MGVPARLALVGLMGLGLAGCTRLQARTPAPSPALEMPPPPGKLVVPSPIPEPAPPPERPAAADDVETPPAGGAPPPRPNRPPPPQPQTPPPASDPQVLRTTTDVAALEHQTVVSLGSAKRDLDRVPVGQLSPDVRAQYNDVRRFIRSAEEALKVRNYVLARQLADKAAVLAAALVKGGAPTFS
jgi:hypothetical protein